LDGFEWCYYPVYESAFDDALAGRCPLTNEEVNKLTELTGVSLWNLNNWQRGVQAQVSFDRPDVSPILDGIRKDKKKYKEAVAILKKGQQRLKKTPRGDIESQLVPCERHQEMMRKYIQQLEKNEAMNAAIDKHDKLYDKEN
jgi:hypothetical protein